MAAVKRDRLTEVDDNGLVLRWLFYAFGSGIEEVVPENCNCGDRCKDDSKVACKLHC